MFGKAKIDVIKQTEIHVSPHTTDGCCFGYVSTIYETVFWGSSALESQKGCTKIFMILS